VGNFASKIRLKMEKAVKTEKTRRRTMKETAEELYVYQGMEIAQIAQIVPASVQSLSKWAKQGEWARRREELKTSPLKIKELLTQEAFSIASGNPPTIDSKALKTISSALELFEKKINLKVIVDVFKEFDLFVVRFDPNIALEFTKFHKLFLKHKIKQEL